MEKKWKVLIVSIVIYQFILTLMMLKLDHYAQWLHFDHIDFPYRWYEDPGATVPMGKALLWLCLTGLILFSVNIYHFRKSAKSETTEDSRSEEDEPLSQL